MLFLGIERRNLAAFIETEIFRSSRSPDRSARPKPSPGHTSQRGFRGTCRENTLVRKRNQWPVLNGGNPKPLMFALGR